VAEEYRMDRSTEIPKWEIRGIMNDFKSTEECLYQAAQSSTDKNLSTQIQDVSTQTAQDDFSNNQEIEEIQIIDVEQPISSAHSPEISLLDGEVKFTEEEIKTLRVQLEKVR
jgi:hypothetical protein